MKYTINPFRSSVLLNFFFLLVIMKDLRPLPPPDKTKEDILLFFKLYDPDKEELRYLLISFLTIGLLRRIF